MGNKRNKYRLASLATATVADRFVQAMGALVRMDVHYFRRFKKLTQQNWRWNKRMARKHRQSAARETMLLNDKGEA